jgi:AbrB family looped-hinge helix DNA binding protein
MAIAHSKITAQGRTSVPVEVRRRLGVGPGSMIEWIAEEERIVVRRSGRYTSGDIHRALFPKKAPAPRTLDELKRGIRRRLREKPG